jgi:phosphohistidine phosphatase
MRHLLLVRHAHAEKQPSLRLDYERRLDERGLKDATWLTEAVKTLKCSMQRVISSPAMRTQTTARAVLEGLSLSRLQLHYEERIYDADRATLIELVRHFPDDCHSLTLVGHNPGISRLARWLCDDEDMDEFVPGQAVLVKADLEHWVDSHKGLFECVKILKPPH